MWMQRAMWVAWPAFLVAAVLEMVVFALLDPHDLQGFGSPMGLSREAVYTLSFFFFWGAAMVSSAVSIWLALPSLESIRRSVVPAVTDRPAPGPNKDEQATALSGKSAD